MTENEHAFMQELAYCKEQLEQSQHFAAHLESNIIFLNERLENEIVEGIKPGDKIEQ